MRKVFITGINRGLGRHLAEQVLDAGGSVAGTTRHLAQLDDLKLRHGNRLLPLPLDVTDFDALAAAVNSAFSAFGHIDAVISNAGYSLLGAAEELTPAAIEKILATNLLASIHLARSAVKLLREQGGGRLIQISSSCGQVGFPGLSLYCASKWGIEGFFEALAGEVAVFGIQTTLVQPGAIRTDFGSSGVLSEPLDVYRGTPAHQFRQMLNQDSQATGDPARMAAAILRTIEQAQAPFRLVLGSDAHSMLMAGLSTRLEQIESCREVSESTDYQVEVRK